MNESTLPTKPLRIRTITAGVDLPHLTALDRLESAIAALERSRERFVATGYEVQTLRIATTPVIARASTSQRANALGALRAIDALAAAHGIIVSLGPVSSEESEDSSLPAWIAQVAQSTKHISLSIAIASAAGIHPRAVDIAAQTMIELSHALPDGVANFRFAAAANIPAGTPFFPVAWHQGPDSLAIGLESASLVEDALATARIERDATASVRSHFNRALMPIEREGAALAQTERRAWLGIDASPAPAKDRSIAAAVEAFTKLPFGSASTLQACATITTALKSLDLKTCGYSGLMLPVLEDPVLAQRAGEGRYTLRDLLLYSSVCGTGLDLVPLPGDTPRPTIAAILGDVAALSARLGKALSARLFLVPDKDAGDIARFDDPLLVDSIVMRPE
jgi:uncharacterized protein (UPF0210 family)